jgi:hypothetical protein
VIDSCARLAALGIRVFDATPERPSSLGPREYEELLGRLAASGIARLKAAIPCVLAAHSGPRAADATRVALATLRADDALTLAFLYRIARCLVVSRGPDLGFRRLRPDLPPIPEEPAEIPGPEEMLGEKGPWFASELARERGVADLAGDAETMFDLWLRLPAAEHEPA